MPGKLTLGELEVAYSEKLANGTVEATTTGKVAEILEKNFNVMKIFFELRKEKIAGFLADEMASAIQDLVNGRPRGGSLTYGAEQRIEAEFRSFLDANEIGNLVVVEAAVQGVSRRKKRPFKKRKARPAFIDTGLYRASFRAVVKLDLPTR